MWRQTRVYTYNWVGDPLLLYQNNKKYFEYTYGTTKKNKIYKKTINLNYIKRFVNISNKMRI